MYIDTYTHFIGHSEYFIFSGAAIKHFCTDFTAEFSWKLAFEYFSLQYSDLLFQNGLQEQVFSLNSAGFIYYPRHMPQWKGSSIVPQDLILNASFDH